MNLTELINPQSSNFQDTVIPSYGSSDVTSPSSHHLGNHASSWYQPHASLESGIYYHNPTSHQTPPMTSYAPYPHGNAFDVNNLLQSPHNPHHYGGHYSAAPHVEIPSNAFSPLNFVNDPKIEGLFEHLLKSLEK